MANKNPNLPKKYSRKHMWWRYLLVFTGGICFTAVGAAAGAAIYSTTAPASQVVGLIPEEYQGLVSFINEEESIYTNVMKFVTKELTVDDILKSVELADIIPESMFSSTPGLYKKLFFYEEPDELEPSSAPYLFSEEPEETPKYAGWKPINLYMIINSKIPAADNTTVSLVDNLMNSLEVVDIMPSIADDEKFSSLANLKIGQLANGLENIKLCDLLNIKPDSPASLMKTICYLDKTTKTVDTTKPTSLADLMNLGDTIMDTPLNVLFTGDGDLMDIFGEKTLNQLMNEDIYLADVLGVDINTTDKILKAICFNGTNKRTVSSLSSDLNGIIMGLKIGDVIDTSSANNLIKALADKTLTQIASGSLFSEIYLADVLGVDPNDSGADQLMKLLCFRKNGGVIDANDKITLADLCNGTEIHNIVESLNIDDVIDCDGSDFLKALKGTSIGDLGTKLADLKLGDAINLENCTGIAYGFLNALKDTKISALDSEFNNVKLVDALASEIYSSGTTLKDSWKLMLFEDVTKTDDDAKNVAYKDYTMADFNKLMTNMTYNMANAKLDNLQDLGLIDVTDETLNKTLNTKRLGDMTLSELITAVGAIL